MGCDIHLYVEYLQSFNGYPIWYNCDHWRLNPYFEYDESSDSETRFNVVSLYRDRNYDLFAILADVRNYGDATTPIDDPRGLPIDVSPIVKEESNHWGNDGHSHSWFTLKELKGNISEEIKRSGLISPEQAKDLDECGINPKTWCQGTSNKDYVRREWSEKYCPLNELIKRIEERKKEVFWIFDKQEHPEFDDKIRIVFWFDN